jgi:ABC-type xylose transport system substrate-binding protein
MVLQNLQGCFVSREFAEHLAQLVMEEKYNNSSIFVAGRSEVVDKGDVWWVTFDNTLPALVGSVRPRSIAVEIRKTNGEIVALPASPSKIDKQHGK